MDSSNSTKNKWIGIKYNAKSANLEEALENATPKCKFCGSKENLGIVYKEVTQFFDPYRIIGYAHNYFECDKCNAR